MDSVIERLKQFLIEELEDLESLKEELEVLTDKDYEEFTQYHRVIGRLNQTQRILVEIRKMEREEQHV